MLRAAHDRRKKRIERTGGTDDFVIIGSARELLDQARWCDLSDGLSAGAHSATIVERRWRLRRRETDSAFLSPQSRAAAMNCTARALTHPGTFKKATCWLSKMAASGGGSTRPVIGLKRRIVDAADNVGDKVWIDGDWRKF